MSQQGIRVRRKSVPCATQYGKYLITGEYYRRDDPTRPWEPWPNGAGICKVWNSTTLKLSELTVDSIHPGPPYKEGGNFTNIKIWYPDNVPRGAGSYEHGSQNYPYGGWYHKYVGGFANPHFPDGMDENQNMDFKLTDGSLTPSLATFGSRAYSSSRPHLEKAGMAVALAEARDIPRMLRTTASGFHDIWRSIGGNIHARDMTPKKVADHFLNWQFGWIPFLKDLRQFYDVYQNSTAYMARITRDNNRWVQRKGTVQVGEPSHTPLNSGFGQRCEPELQTWIYTNWESPTWTTEWIESNHVTSAGSFKYYRPEFDPSLPSYDSSYSAMQRQLLLYGARISPSNVYKATPWTWLIDWFSNVGKTVDQASDWALDGIVSRYLYVMSHYRLEYRMTNTIPTSAGKIPVKFSRTYESKRRVEAGSAYGFGLSDSDLSARQLAILIALGISKRKP